MCACLIHTSIDILNVKRVCLTYTQVESPEDEVQHTKRRKVEGREIYPSILDMLYVGTPYSKIWKLIVARYLVVKYPLDSSQSIFLPIRHVVCRSNVDNHKRCNWDVEIIYLYGGCMMGLVLCLNNFRISSQRKKEKKKKKL